MTNPTRTDIIRAHEALDDICNLVIMSRGYPANEYRNLILRALPPEPHPTMAEIEWDEDLHYLAEAEHKDGRTVIMLTRDSSTRINFIWNELIDSTYPQNLTPTGRLYTLKEVQ